MNNDTMFKLQLRVNISLYECDDCSEYESETKCTNTAVNKKMQVSKVFAQKKQKSLDNIGTPERIILRINRSIQVDGVFGVLKEDYGFRRFCTRGKENVRIEFMLLSLGHTINKLHSRIQNERCGALLHEVKLLGINK